MKKALSVLMLSLVVVLGFTGCGRQGSAPPDSFSAPPQQTTQADNYNATSPMETLSLIPGTASLFISAGGGHTMVIDTDGNLWGWGNNFVGQVGDGTRDNRYSPIRIMSDVVMVSSGRSFTTAVTEDNSLWIWGINIGVRDSNYNEPVRIMGDVVAVSAGGDHAMAITDDGSLWAWGSNASGQLGLGHEIRMGFTDYSIPVRIMEDVVAVSSGNDHTMALTADGSLWTWGSNTTGQLGHGVLGMGFPEHVKPVRIMENVVAISAGAFHSMAIRNDGSLWAWGQNSRGELGDGSTQFRQTPVHIMNDVAVVSSGGHHTMAVANDGVLWGWGENTSGEILDDSIPRHANPVQVVSDVVAVSSGNGYTVALFTNGEVWGWGRNAYGQLGVGYTTNIHGIDRIMSILEHGGDSESVPACFGVAPMNDIAPEEIRRMVRNYVPQFGGNYSLEDIPNALLSDYINILRSRGFVYETVKNAAQMAMGVGVGSLLIIEQFGYEQITHTSIDNMEYQVGFKDTANGVEVMIIFNGTDPTSPRDWTANTNRSLVDGVHRGYWEMAEKLINDGNNVRFYASDITVYTLSDLINSPNTKFTLIGHSMGGAIAQAYAIHLLDRGVSRDNIYGITFNSALVVTARQRHYTLDLQWFNIMNRTDNVAAGAVWFSLEANGLRLGYDIPLNDPFLPNRHYALNTLLPNGEHGIHYLWNVLTHEANERILSGGQRSFDSSLVNINTASENELMTLPGIGSVIANSIIQYREESGLFISVEDIKLVNHIGDTAFKRIENLITVD